MDCGMQNIMSIGILQKKEVKSSHSEVLLLDPEAYRNILSTFVYTQQTDNHLY